MSQARHNNATLRAICWFMVEGFISTTEVLPPLSRKQISGNWEDEKKGCIKHGCR